MLFIWNFSKNIKKHFMSQMIKFLGSKIEKSGFFFPYDKFLFLLLYNLE